MSKKYHIKYLITKGKYIDYKDLLLKYTFNSNFLLILIY